MTLNTSVSLRVIVVEDEPKLRENLVIGLAHHDFEVTGVAVGVSMADQFHVQAFHCKGAVLRYI